MEAATAPSANLLIKQGDITSLQLLNPKKSFMMTYWDHDYPVIPWKQELVEVEEAQTTRLFVNLAREVTKKLDLDISDRPGGEFTKPWVNLNFISFPCW